MFTWHSIQNATKDVPWSIPPKPAFQPVSSLCLASLLLETVRSHTLKHTDVFFPLFIQVTEFSTGRSRFLMESWHRLPDTRLQWHSYGCLIGDRLCSVRQAIILTREAIGHFQESEPFCHMDPEESEKTGFLNLLGTIFKGKSLFLQSANKTLQLYL